MQVRVIAPFGYSSQALPLTPLIPQARPFLLQRQSLQMDHGRRVYAKQTAFPLQTSRVQKIGLTQAELAQIMHFQFSVSSSCSTFQEVSHRISHQGSLILTWPSFWAWAQDSSL